MAFEPYGSNTWSNEPAPAINPVQQQLLALGGATAAGAGFIYGGSRIGDANWNPIDSVIEGAAFAGDMSPFGLGNTFRIPEFLSPFGSPSQQNLSKLDNGKFGFKWDQEFLKSRDTQVYLQEAFGLTGKQLEDAGITPKMVGSEGSLASELVFERTANSPKGSLYSIVGDQKKLLSSDVSIMRMVRDSPELLQKERSVNRAAFGVFQAMDMWKHEGFSAERVFRRKDLNPDQLKKAGLDPNQFMPVPSLTGQINDAGDVWRRSALVRAVPAFEIERFNRLASGMVHQTFGQAGETAFKKLTGLGLETMPGPASNTLGRVGGRVIAVGAALGAVSQIDWFRRNYDTAGEVVASGTISAGAAYVTNKLTGSPKTGMMVGVASFFGQTFLPGFDEGVIPGMATSYARANTLRANEFNPVNYYRRTLEGFAPGISNWETGALLGIGVAAAAYSGAPQRMINAFGHSSLGLPSQVVSSGEVFDVNVPKSARTMFWEGVASNKDLKTKINMQKYGKSPGFIDRFRLGTELFSKRGEFGGLTKLGSRLNNIWDSAEERHRVAAENNPLNKALTQKLESISAKYDKPDFLSRLRKEASGFGTQSYYSFFGADAAEAETAKAIRGMGFGEIPLPDMGEFAKHLGLDASDIPKRIPISPTGRFGRIMSLGIAAFGAQQLLTGGALGSMQTREELEDIYSGKQMVEVRKSRWWEGGGTPFEGGKATYFRPHAYHLMMNRTREKGIWGEAEDKISPFKKFYKKNFTYDLETENYYDRPYPISSAAFSDIPIVGGILSATVGRLVKPPKLMHVDEWVRQGQDGNMEYASTYEGWRREPAYNLGATKPGIPGSPFSAEQQAYFMSYQFRELEGMTGWAKNVLSDIIAGNDVYGTDQPMLAEAGMMTSPKLRFWETNQGGLFFSNEIIRRILPRYRSEIERQNPLMNSMPTWLPERFRRGDPYRNVEWGEARLPGTAYEDLHPELKGIDPQDYPLIHRYAILADVAPYTSNFRMTRKAVYAQRSRGQTSEAENAYMDMIDKQVTTRYNVYEFDKVHENAIQLPGSGITQALSGGAKSAIRKAAAPGEYLVPMGFRPVQKLLGDDRDPIERYEYERLYGTQFAFWDKPWRDWFRPAMYSAANLFGFEGKPEWRKESDANQEYFDKLEFAKWMRLSEEAKAAGDSTKAHQYSYMAANTRHGVNPQGNPLSIYWSLPKDERAFFNAFAQAQGGDRNRILEMVPEDQAHLYQTVWNRLDQGDPGMFAGSNTSVDQQYLAQQFHGLDDYFKIQGAPPDDWVGWHEDVDIGDIRVRYIDEIGQDLHDHGQWSGQLKQSMAQPYLEGSTDPLPSGGGIGRAGIWRQMHSMLPSQTTIHTSIDSRAKINYNDDRVESIRAGLGDYLGGY